LLRKQADYTKGNRFYRPESVQDMSKLRLFGNGVLSFLTKLSCGYWNVMDPTNGYTAVRTHVLQELPLDKLENRYFFETDMLFRLNTIRAVVKDIPMDSVYADEESNLKIGKILPEFLRKHSARLWRRYVYNYIVRDFNVGTLHSLAGSFLVLFGTVFGIWHWIAGSQSHQPASSGTVMLAALPILIGLQCLIAFLHYDVSNVPTEPLSQNLDKDLTYP
ncbi:MAG: glycosyltransferase family 2 protein, partial [Alcaligenaceae bacterium]